MKIDKRLSQLEAVTTEPTKYMTFVKVDGVLSTKTKKDKEIYNSIEEAREVYPDHRFIIYNIVKPPLNFRDEN
jgi:hypothetical protein